MAGSGTVEEAEREGCLEVRFPRLIQGPTDRIVARSARLRRFTPVESWEAATLMTTGYESVARSENLISHAGHSGDLHNLGEAQLQAIAAFGMALDALGEKPIKVMDVGGGDGTYSGLIMAAFPNREFRWTVLETPTVIAAYMSKSNSSQVAWTSDIDAVSQGAHDVVFASGAVQYFAQPDEILRSIMVGAEFAIITRAPLWPFDHHRPAAQFVRRGTNIGYPTWFLSDEVFRQMIDAGGGRVAAEWSATRDSIYFEGFRLDCRGVLIDCRAAS